MSKKAKDGKVPAAKAPAVGKGAPPTHHATEPAVVAAPEAPIEDETPIDPLIEITRANKVRVFFPKLPVKQIVSYHSSTILADPEPTITIPESTLTHALEAFRSILADRTVISHVELEEIMLSKITIPKTENPASVSMIKATIKKYLPEDISEVSEGVFIEFLGKFLAPSFFYGQRLRLSAGRNLHTEVIELVAARQCGVNTANGEGLTALHYAVEHGRVDMISTLISLDCDINPQDKHGWTPLHIASHHGHVACVLQLLKMKANTSLVTTQGKTCLHLACAQNRGNIVQLLITAGISLIAQDTLGLTPLHEAAFGGHTVLFQELSRDKRADLTIKDSMGYVAADYLGIDENIREFL